MEDDSMLTFAGKELDLRVFGGGRENMFARFVLGTKMYSLEVADNGSNIKFYEGSWVQFDAYEGWKNNYLANFAVFHATDLRIQGKEVDVDMRAFAHKKMYGRIASGTSVSEIEISKALTFYEGGWTSFYGYEGGTLRHFLTNCILFHS